MNEKRMIALAKSWAKMFVKNREEFLKGLETTVGIGLYGADEWKAIISLANVYENFLTREKNEEEVAVIEKGILEEYQNCIMKRTNAADVMRQDTNV